MEQNTNTSAAENTAIAAAIMPELGEKVDFGPLERIIEQLGNANAQLTDSEKQAARGVITEWEDNVVRRLRDQAEDAQSCLDMLNFSYRRELDVNDNLLEQLAEAADVRDLFDKYIENTEKVLMHRACMPQKDGVDTSMAVKDTMAKEQAYQLELQLYRIEHDRLEREVTKSLNRLIGVLNDNEDIQALKSRLKAYRRNISRYESDCDSKAQAAKIAISISSPEVRGLLKELVNFSVKL